MPSAAGPGSVRKPSNRYGQAAGPVSVRPPLVPSISSLRSLIRRNRDGTRYAYVTSVAVMAGTYGSVLTFPRRLARHQLTQPQARRQPFPSICLTSQETLTQYSKHVLGIRFRPYRTVEAAVAAARRSGGHPGAGASAAARPDVD